MYTKYAQLRDERGLTDADVSRGTGIARTTLYDWRDRDKEKPGAGTSFANITKIAEFFGVTVDAFTD